MQRIKDSNASFLEASGFPLFGEISPDDAMRCAFAAVTDDEYARIVRWDDGSREWLHRARDEAKLPLWRGHFWGGEGKGAVGTYWIPQPFDAGKLITACVDHPDFIRDAHRERQGIGQAELGLLCTLPSEIDDAPLAEQVAAHRWIEDETGIVAGCWALSGDTRLPPGMDPMKHSVGKSIHRFVSFVPAEASPANVELWKRVARLQAVLLRADLSNIRQAQLMRLPGVIGREPDGSRFRVQTCIVARRDVPRLTLEEIEARLLALARREGILDVAAAERAIRLSFRCWKKAEKDREKKLGGRLLDLSRRIRDARWATADDLREAKDLGAIDAREHAEQVGVGKGRGVRDIDPTRKIDDRTLAEWGASLGPRGKTEVRCPFHGDSTASAFVSVTPSGRAFLHCPQVCGVSWGERRERADSWTAPSLPPLPPDSVEMIGQAPHVDPFTEEARRRGIIVQNFGASDVTADFRFVTNLPLIRATKHVVAMHLDTGSGKTTLVKNLIASGRFRRVLIVSHREAIADGQAVEVGARSYKEFLQGGDILCDLLGVCLNSIVRVPSFDPETFEPYDLVVIEESESTADHLHHGTIGTQRSEKGVARDQEAVLARLRQICRACLKGGGFVVANDAFVSDLTLDFLRAITDIEPADVLVTKLLKPRSGFKVIRYSAKEDLTSRCLQWAGEGLRVGIACTSAEDARTVAELLRGERVRGERPVRVLAYWQGAETDRKGLRNVNETWSRANCDAVIFSPSIDSAISYDPADAAERFDRVVLIGQRPVGQGGTTFGLNKLFQMHDRFRNTTEFHVFVDGAWRHDLPCDQASCMGEIEARAKAVLNALADEGKTFTASPINEAHKRNAALALRMSRLRSRNVPVDYFAWWDERGAVVEEGSMLDPQARREFAEWMKEAKERVIEREIKATLTAEPLYQPEYLDLQKKGARTPGEARSLKRSGTIHRLGAEGLNRLPEDRFGRLSLRVRRLVDAGLILSDRFDVVLAGDERRARAGVEATLRADALAVRMALQIAQAGHGEGIRQVLAPLTTVPCIAPKQLRVPTTVPVPPPADGGVTELGFGGEREIESSGVGGEIKVTVLGSTPLPRTHDPHEHGTLTSHGGHPETNADTLIGDFWLSREGFADAVREVVAQGGGEAVLARLGLTLEALALHPLRDERGNPRLTKAGKTVTEGGLSYFLGTACGFLGISRTCHQLRDGKERITAFTLDTDEIASLVALAARQNLRRRGHQPPPLDAIDPALLARMRASAGVRGDAPMDELEAILDGMFA